MKNSFENKKRKLKGRIAKLVIVAAIFMLIKQDPVWNKVMSFIPSSNTVTAETSPNGEVSENAGNGENVVVPEEIVHNWRYVSGDSVKVYAEKNTYGKVATTLIKGTRVDYLASEEEELQEIKNVKNAQGKVEKVYIDKIQNWDKIEYTKNNKTSEGWIMTGSLAEDRYSILPEEWKDLDFVSLPKKAAKTDVHGIYVTNNVAGIDSRMDKLIELTKKTEINTFVIDVKGDFGYMSFNIPEAEQYSPRANKSTNIKDIAALMKKLKDNNIYTIARIVSFKDPEYAKAHPDRCILDTKTKKPYANKDGVSWVSPHDRTLWEYNVAVAKAAAAAGFDEIQFDYVRFPATGGAKNETNIDFRNTEKESKPVAIQKYLKYAQEELKDTNVAIGADTYGQIGTMSDDMGIGQYWESVSAASDVMSPMIYPSHYKAKSYGISVPDADPYKTVLASTRDSVNRNINIDNPGLIRPWIQAFTATWVKGHINYGKKEVDDQIKALNELGIEGYILWNPKNNYDFLIVEETKKEEPKKEETKVETPKTVESKPEEAPKGASTTPKVENNKTEAPSNLTPVLPEETKKDNSPKLIDRYNKAVGN